MDIKKFFKRKNKYLINQPINVDIKTLLDEHASKITSSNAEVIKELKLLNDRFWKWCQYRGM